MIRAALAVAVFLVLVGPLTAGAAAVLTDEISIGGTTPSPLAGEGWGEGAHE